MFGRVEVAGGSMLPTYGPGDWLLVWYSRRRARVGLVVVVRRPDRLVVKRVASVLPDGSVLVTGDNPAASTDSRAYGPVAATDVLGRVLFRYRRGSRPRC